MFWLVFDTDDGRVIILQPASTLIFARMSAVVNKLVEGKYVEGHELEPKHVKKFPRVGWARRSQLIKLRAAEEVGLGRASNAGA